MSAAGMLRPSHRYRSDRRTMPASGPTPHRPQPDGLVPLWRTSGTGILSRREGWVPYRLRVLIPPQAGCRGKKGVGGCPRSSAGRSTSETLLRPLSGCKLTCRGALKPYASPETWVLAGAASGHAEKKNQWFSELSGQWGRQLNRLTLVLDHLSIIHIGVVRTSIGAGQRSQQVSHRRLYRSMVDCPLYDHRTDSIFLFSGLLYSS
jgi:hypothetical protein